jgi:hypothetical protein
VPQPQESQPDLAQEASPEEEPFEIELVVPESPTAQDTPAEEKQQPEDHNTKDKTNEEHPPPSDTKDEKMYRDADEVESFGVESLILAGRLRFAGTPRHHHRSLVQDQVSPAFKASRVQGHHRDFLQIQDPLPTQGTSLQDFTQ